MEIHELANIIPNMSDEEYQALKLDIQTNGLLNPIMLYENKILDGRNRYKVCQELNIEPKYETYEGNSPVSYVISINIKRRHLNNSQIACILLDAKPKIKEEAKKRMLAGKKIDPTQLLGEGGKGESNEILGKIGGISSETIRVVERIKEENLEAYEQIKQGKKSPFEIQREKKEKKQEKIREENQILIKKNKPVLPDQKFQTITIDPPWDWGDEGDINQLGRAKPIYNTMPFEEILALPIKNLSENNAHIYLWITNRSLPKGFKLLEEWGFRYITCLTWCKESFGMGNYFRGQTEHVLFGVKGSLPLLRKDVGTWFNGKRGNQHSSKPEEFYKLVESCSPGPWLEMFGIKERPGWVKWGIEHKI